MSEDSVDFNDIVARLKIEHQLAIIKFILAVVADEGVATAAITADQACKKAPADRGSHREVTYFLAAWAWAGSPS